MAVVALDFETADKYADSACALGMVRLEGGRVADTWYRLIRPPRSRVAAVGAAPDALRGGDLAGGILYLYVCADGGQCRR